VAGSTCVPARPVQTSEDPRERRSPARAWCCCGPGTLPWR